MAKKDAPPTAATTAYVPDLQHVVQQVRDSRAWDFTTKAGLCEYSNAVVVALHAQDENFGHLKKTEGQNHCVDPTGQNCAVDVSLYLASGQVIDFISSAGYGTPPPPNDVTWGVGPVGEYPAGAWFAPVAGADSGGGDGGTDTGGGDVSAETQAQLDRMEAQLTQIQLYMSNINDQQALMGGELNNMRVAMDRPLSGGMVKPGETLTLRP